MTMTLNLSPQIEAALNAAAQQQGIPPTALVEKMIQEQFVQVAPDAPVIDAENAAVIALMDEWLAEAPTDPEEIRQAQAELDELMQDLNRNRIESGEEPLLP